MATNVTAFDQQSARERPPIGFGATLASEWTKLISTRSTYLMLGLAVLLSFAMTGLLALAVGATWEDAPAETKLTWEPISFSIVGLIFGGILLTVLGVLLVSSEYTSGMIRLSLAATPRRGRFLAAKIAIITAVTLIATFLITIGVLLIGKTVLDSYNVPTFAMTDSDTIRAIIALTLTAPLYPLIGVALAILFRSTATPITLVLALMFIPAMFGGIFPRWWQENILSFLPGSAADSLSLSHVSDSQMYLDTGPAAVVFVAWLVIIIGTAYFALTRRDA